MTTGSKLNEEIQKMAVLLNRRFFIAILLVAIYETKVIRYICVMILVNFFNYFIGWSGDHCRAKNIFFLFVTKMFGQNKHRMLQLSHYWVQHAASYFYTFFVTNSGDCDYIFIWYTIFIYTGKTESTMFVKAVKCVIKHIYI